MGACFSSQFDPLAYNFGEELYEEILAALPSLSGKAVVITGTSPNSMGYHCALLAARKGAAKVFLLNRPSDRAKAAHEAVTKVAPKGTEVQSVDCDLMSFPSVRQAAGKVQALLGGQGLDVLALNAGVMAMNDTRTPEGFEVQMHTNQLAHVLLLSLLMPQLQSAASAKGDARVVFHSSSARDLHRWHPDENLKAEFFQKCDPGTLGGDSAGPIAEVSGLSRGPWGRYHQTKLANACYAMKLHAELQAKGSKIKALAVDPGAATTELQKTSIEQGLMGASMANMMMGSGQSAADGACNLIMACFSPEADSGDFYMPEKGLKGRPIKTISRGQAVKAGTEKCVLLPANQDLAWEQSHAALGIASLF